MKDARPLEVHWRDACHHSGWQDRPTKPLRAEKVLNLCRSVGYPVKSSPGVIILAQSETILPIGEVGDWIVIPRAAIVKMRRLT